MKFLSILSVLALCAITIFSACKNEGNAARDAAVENATPTTTNPSTPAPATPEPAQNAEGVWHYTCPNGCEGGAGAVGPCPKCGATLAHNTSYHGNANPAAPTPAPGTAATPPVAPAKEPAQNAAGVWHYTCSNGCEGGAGSAIACSKCGSTLVHNTAYHQ